VTPTRRDRAEQRAEKKQKALELAAQYPELPTAAIAERLQVACSSVAVWLREAGLARPAGARGRG
jgi:hypothetical protein